MLDDSTGHVYYQDHTTGDVTWEDPESEAMDQELQELEQLHSERYVVCHNWLADASIDLLRTDALAVDDTTGLDCSTGSKDLRQIDPTVRKSRQSSVIPPPPNTAGSIDTRSQLIDAVNDVRSQLQASALLDLPQLEPFETELNYLLYPVGGHYKRHLDVPYYDDGWVRQGRRASPWVTSRCESAA